jgi:hypothetical protein
MSIDRVNEEMSLRIATPELYMSMVKVFEKHNIHSYDTQGTVMKVENGFEITLKFSNGFSQSVTTHVTLDQAVKPDNEVTNFFEETAEKCKTRLISDYFKMVKP